jgi:hypothetical protein
MNVQKQIKEYIASQSVQKATELESLHNTVLSIAPACKLWFFDGKDANGKVVSNPNIGYGLLNIKYADGSTKEFYQIGLSGNSTGISVYIMGIDDKKYLLTTYGDRLGKASISGYCIKFRTLKNINVDVLAEAIRYGFEHK